MRAALYADKKRLALVYVDPVDVVGQKPRDLANGDEVMLVLFGDEHERPEPLVLRGRLEKL